MTDPEVTFICTVTDPEVTFICTVTDPEVTFICTVTDPQRIHSFATYKSGPELPRSYVMVFSMFSG